MLRRTFLQLSALLATSAKMNINTRQIPRTKEALPVVGLGTWQTFDVGTSKAERKPIDEVLTDATLSEAFGVGLTVTKDDGRWSARAS